MRRAIRINASKVAIARWYQRSKSNGGECWPCATNFEGSRLGWQKLFWELELLQGWWWWTLWHYWVYHCHHWVTWWCFCHALLSPFYWRIILQRWNPEGSLVIRNKIRYLKRWFHSWRISLLRTLSSLIIPSHQNMKKTWKTQVLKVKFKCDDNYFEINYEIWSYGFGWKFSRYLFWPCFFKSLSVCYNWWKVL